MNKFTVLNGLVAPLDRENVDTDAIIPKQFLKSIHRSGFGPHCFDEWRYLDTGYIGIDPASRKLNPDFELNQPRYEGASILLTRENFGCGSSREHAPWALEDFGLRAMIAPSFADIFYNNSLKNGLLPIVAAPDVVEGLFAEVAATPGYRLQVDLAAQQIVTPSGEAIAFTLDPFKRHCLLNGLDDIALALRHAGQIRGYEQVRRQREPWLFN